MYKNLAAALAAAIHAQYAFGQPKAVVKVVWLDSWFGAPREREAAMTLLDQGADVLSFRITNQCRHGGCAGAWQAGRGLALGHAQRCA